MDTLIYFLITGIAFVCVIPILGFFLGRVEFIEFPLLFSLTVLGWFFPQLIAESYCGQLPDEAVFKATLMALLCISATLVGYGLYKPRLIGPQSTGDINKLVNYIFIFSLVLLVPFFILRTIPQEELAGAWSGRPVALLFFYSALKYTSLYAFLIWLGGKKNKKVSCVICIGLFYYLLTTIGAGRKADSLDLFFGITGGLFFLKNYRLPKLATICFALLFAIVIPSTGPYRNIVMSPGENKFGRVLEIEWIENFKSTFTNTGGEVRNYIMGVLSIDNEGPLDYGLFHWNSFAFRYVPQQIFGSDIKNSFMAPVSNPVQEAAKYGHEGLNGQTYTGMLDAFGSFWFFGFIKFLLIGVAFKHLYCRARQGILNHQMVYIFLLGSGLHSVTHTTDWCLFAFIHLWIFTWPYKKYAALKWPPTLKSEP